MNTALRRAQATQGLVGGRTFYNEHGLKTSTSNARTCRGSNHFTMNTALRRAQATQGLVGGRTFYNEHGLKTITSNSRTCKGSIILQ